MDTPAQLLFHADVRVMDSGRTRTEALAWRDGRVLAVGSLAEVARAAGPDAHRWDVGGAVVLPGFVDAHHHASLCALYGGLVKLAAPQVTDIASLQRTLAAASADVGPGAPPNTPGAWLVATDWDEARLAERRAPTRAELDEAVPGRPLVALHYSCHRAVANSRALELAGIGRDTADPPGGLISRGRGGLPAGLLIERAMSRVEALARASLVARDAEGFFTRLAAHHRAILAAGITRVVDPTVSSDLLELYQEAVRRGVVRVPTVMLPVSTTGYLDPPGEALDGPVTGTGNGPLRVGPVKLFFDGSACALCLTAWQSLVGFFRTCALAVRQGSLDPVRAWADAAPVAAQRSTGAAVARTREEPS